jgi:hypothetical protein
MSRRAFVAVVTSSVLVANLSHSREASANPPAPSNVPDPVASAAPKAGEHSNRIKRHDGGCFLHYESGAAKKIDCPTVMDKAGEQIEREPESGQCVLIEPWAEEPKETPCPPVLVPADWKPPAPPPSAEPKTASLAPEPQKAKSGCAGCTTSRAGSDPAAVVSVAAAVCVLRRRRQRLSIARTKPASRSTQ